MMSKKVLDKNRRTLLKTLPTIFLLENFFLFPLFAAEDSYLLKGPLAGKLYYTEEKPGRWSNLIGSHIPVYEIENNIIKVSTPHEMRGYEHYIIKHMILDEKFNMISEKNFDPSRENAISKHNIIGFKNKIYILSICNQHDTWLIAVKI